MAFHYFFNMEPLALKIARNHVANMTNDNFYDKEDCFLDDKKVSNNLENGFVVLTQLTCYLESFLNTILDSCMKYEGEALLKCSIEEKMEIIFMYYNSDFSTIKSMHYWQNYKTATRVRNEMIHYKKTSIGYGGFIPDFEIGKQEVSSYFTKDNMLKVIDTYILFCKEIVKSVGLDIFDDMPVFICDGTSTLVNYVYDPNTTEKESIDFLKELKKKE